MPNPLPDGSVSMIDCASGSILHRRTKRKRQRESPARQCLLPEVGESEGPARRFFVRGWGQFRLRHAGSPLDRVRASIQPCAVDGGAYGRQIVLGHAAAPSAPHWCGHPDHREPHVDEARAVIACGEARLAARPSRRDLLSSAGNDQEASQRVASGRDFSASSRSAAIAGSPPWGPAARPSSRRRSRSWTRRDDVYLDADQRVWVRSRLMSVRRSGVCRAEPGPAGSQVVITNFPPVLNRRAPRLRRR